MEEINEKHRHSGDWQREIVFGLNDGLVTTLPRIAQRDY